MARIEHEVAIIGAGLGGLGVAIALDRAGLGDYVILERGADIGGTWRDNTYPGVAVDVPARAYQFSFELNASWQRTYATGAEVKAYIDRLASRHGLRPRIRLGCEVAARTWDEGLGCWALELAEAGGARRTLRARYVVSAIGAFVEPRPVDIPGVERFAGITQHSARWDHGPDLAGKRVAVVGTGASAVQIVPIVARHASHLTVFQRTPIWVAPKADPLVPPAVAELYRRFPRVHDVVRRAVTRATEYMLVDTVLAFGRHPERVHRAEAWLRRWYRTQVPDPELRRKLTPTYGFGCKRPAVSNHYLRTFNRPNVRLVTDAIDHIDADGVATADGVHHPVDALVLATGFRMASDPAIFRRTPVTGRGGFDLATFYETERLSSYESISIPGLPNHFMIFGPYGWVGGTWHELVESASTHIVRVLCEARRRGRPVVEVRREAAHAWTERMRARMASSLFLTSNCATANSYYFDHHGDVPYLRPTSARAARHAARTFPLDDYRFDPPPPGHP